jgi:alpha-glucuronidase
MIYLFRMVILPSYVSSKRKVNCAVVKLPVVVEPTNFDFYITRGYHGKSQHFLLKKMVRKNPRDPEEVENSREFSFSRCGALAVGSYF